MKRLSHATLLVTITAVALFAEPNSSIQFYEEDGSTETAQMGWDGDNGSFYIETPGSATPLEMKNGDLTVPGEVSAEKFKGDGSGLKNLQASELGAVGGDLPGSYSNMSINRDAVTSEKIDNGAVTSSKLADDAVTTSKIDNKAVTSSKIADEAVGTNQIDDNAVTSSKIANGTITESDLSSSLDSKIDGKMDKSGGTFTGTVTFPENKAVLVRGNLNLYSTVLAQGGGKSFLSQNSSNDGDHLWAYARNSSDNGNGDTWIMALSRLGGARKGRGAFRAYGPSSTEEWAIWTELSHDGTNGTLKANRFDLVLSSHTNEIVIEGTLTETSDRRLKHSIRGIQDPLEKVIQLEGVSFKRNGGNKNEIGFIAQDIEKTVPEVVHTGGDGYKSVAYQNITALLVEAIKEQQTQIEKLTRTVQELQNRKSIDGPGPEVH